jgi:hypothetical protein
LANSTPAGLKIEYDTSTGGLQDITQYIQTINEIDVESLTEETHTFGDSWEEHLPIGIGKMAPIELGGLYESSTSGINGLFGGRAPETPSSSTRTIKVTWIATANNTSVETYLKNYKRAADRNAITRFSVTLQPTGTVTESTS